MHAQEQTIAIADIDLDHLVADGSIEAALCEPSAALQAPWDPEVVLVGDNEVREQLYAFAVTADGLSFVEALDIPKEGGKRPRDIEALAAIEDSVLIVGSHSRNTSCEERENRQRMERVRLAGGALAADDFINGENELDDGLRSERDCVETLFVAPPPEGADLVCAALVGAADVADGAPPCACTTINIEGAVGLPDRRVWLGLRAPLAERNAIMLRLAADNDDLRFDRVVLVDLGNRGIRELAYDPARERVWGLAGPDIDRADPFRLWHVATADLTDRSLVRGTKDPRELPTSSEGLVILEDRGVVLIDGDAGDDDDTCAVHARHYQLALSP